MCRKKLVYMLIVLGSLTFVGCGGGSSTPDGTIPPIDNTVPIDDNTSQEDDTTPPLDNTPPTGSTPSEDITDPTDDNTSQEDDTSSIDNNLTLDDFADATPHDPYFESTHFSGSKNCASCHDGIKDTSTTPDTDVSLVKAWKGTMMANAAIDPLYLAKVASEVQRNPDFKEVIEKKCSRCHMPMANVEAGFIDQDLIAMSGDGFLNPTNDYYHLAKEGVSCTLCHQIEDKNLGTELGFSGDFTIDQNTGKPNRKIYGPYTDPKQAGRMQNAVGFIPVGEVNVTGENHMTDSKLCASCHNLNTPVINASGSLSNPLIEFPEQAVYTEWEFSKFSNSNTKQSCQECHMPTTKGSVVIATGGSTQTPLTGRSPFHQHKFLGANTYMIDIIKNNLDKLGAKADEASFEDSISDTRDFLTGNGDFLKAAADVNITDISFVDNALQFSVKVTNHSGHKFPTSIPIRRAWLHVKVTKVSDQSTVFESGAMNDRGQIIGVDDTTGYEEHYESINDASEVQVYEAIMADTNGDLTYTFLNASRYLKDNRLLPEGYKNTTPASAQPYGEALDDDNFIGGSDTVNYEIDNLLEGEYTIAVTLKYQTVSYGFMQDLYRDQNLTEVALMKVLDENAKIRFEDISTDTVSIP